jgi:hypothetical protein
MSEGEKKRFGNFAEYAKARQANKVCSHVLPLRLRESLSAIPCYILRDVPGTDF